MHTEFSRSTLHIAILLYGWVYLTILFLLLQRTVWSVVFKLYNLKHIFLCWQFWMIWISCWLQYMSVPKMINNFVTYDLNIILQAINIKYYFIMLILYLSFTFFFFLGTTSCSGLWPSSWHHYTLPCSVSYSTIF